MADKPVNEVVQVDAALDALSSPTSSDVYEALLPFGNDAVSAVAAKRAAAGGGGGGSQTIEVVRVPIVFNTADLVVSPGIVLYTPVAGDILTAASCVSIETAWNGTDPYLRLFSQGEGVVSDGITSVDLTLANGAWSAKTANIQVFLGAGWTGFPAAALRFADATPLMAAVTQLGGATDPVSTQGAGEIVLEILKVTP